MRNFNLKYLLLIWVFCLGLLDLSARHPFTDADFAIMEKIDSLEHGLISAPTWEEATRVIVDAYLYAKKLHTAEEYQYCISLGEKILSASEEWGLRYSIGYMEGDFHFLIGSSYEQQYEYTDALGHFEQVITLPDESFKYKSPESGYDRLAQIYQSLGDYNKGFEYALMALDKYESANDSLNIAKTVYGIGTIMFYQFNYEKALSYFERALVISEAINGESTVYSCLAAIGSAHEQLGNSEEALQYLFCSWDIATSINYRTGRAYALGNIGRIYLSSLNDYSKAKEYLLQSLEIKLNMDDKWGQASTYQSLGECARLLGDHKESILFLGKGEALANEMNSKSQLLGIYETYVKIYKNTNDFQALSTVLTNIIHLKDTLINESTENEIAEAQTRYEVQKRESEILLLMNEKSLLEKEQRISNLNFYLLGGSLIFMLTLSLIWFSRFRMQKRMIGLLEEKNALINQQNERLKEFDEHPILENSTTIPTTVSNPQAPKTTRAQRIFNKLIPKDRQEEITGDLTELQFYLEEEGKTKGQIKRIILWQKLMIVAAFFKERLSYTFRRERG